MAISTLAGQSHVHLMGMVPEDRGGNGIPDEGGIMALRAGQGGVSAGQGEAGPVVVE